MIVWSPNYHLMMSQPTRTHARTHRHTHTCTHARTHAHTHTLHKCVGPKNTSAHLHNGIHRTGLLAEPTVNTLGHINVVACCPATAIITCFCLNGYCLHTIAQTEDLSLHHVAGNWDYFYRDNLQQYHQGFGTIMTKILECPMHGLCYG